MLTSAKRVLLAGCLLLAGAAVLLFMLENPQRIHLVFLGAASAELPVAALMMISFILGLLTCLLFSLWVLGRWRMRVAQLRHADLSAVQSLGAGQVAPACGAATARACCSYPTVGAGALNSCGLTPRQFPDCACGLASVVRLVVIDADA